MKTEIFEDSILSKLSLDDMISWSNQYRKLINSPHMVPDEDITKLEFVSWIMKYADEYAEENGYVKKTTDSKSIANLVHVVMFRIFEELAFRYISVYK